MDKIRLKVSFNVESQTFQELENLLSFSVRHYEHISVHNTKCDDTGCLQFFKNNRKWKSLKLSLCRFQSVDSQVAFLSLFAPSLEEAEFEDQFSAFNLRWNQFPSVVLPKLTKLKTGALTVNVRCKTLKILDLTMANQSCILELLRLNQQALEDFTFSYEVLEGIFNRDIAELGIHLNLKRIHLQRHHNPDPMGATSIRNFQTFLKSQSNTVEEFVIDWFVGRPRGGRRRTNTEYFQLQGPHRARGQNARNDPFMRLQRQRFEERQRFFNDDHNPMIEDICNQAITTVFQDYKVIRKLIVSDRHGFLSGSTCPPITFLNIVPNPCITELRLRFEKAPLTDVLFEKLVTACPNLKQLFVHDMDQSQLECCSRELRNVESIFALSFKVDCLPSEKVKFKNLKRVLFCECVIQNHPELNDKKLFEQKSAVLDLVRDTST